MVWGRVHHFQQRSWVMTQCLLLSCGLALFSQAANACLPCLFSCRLPASCLCRPRKDRSCHARAACFLFWLLLLLVLPPQPKRQLALGPAPRAELGDRISACAPSRLRRKPPPCILDLPCAPLVGAGHHFSTWQHGAKNCCVSSTGCMRVCVPRHASMQADQDLHVGLQGT